MGNTKEEGGFTLVKVKKLGDLLVNLKKSLTKPFIYLYQIY